MTDRNPPPLASAALPPVARRLARVAGQAVAAAREQDLAAFEHAVGTLAGLEVDHVNRVLGLVVRNLLEEGHPDGLSGDDLGQVVGACLRSTTPWDPQVQGNALVTVVTAALGVHDSAAGPLPYVSPDRVARHAALVIAELLTTVRRPFTALVSEAFVELSRAELGEQP